MSYDYLDDLFGESRRGRHTKYSDVEAKAAKALADIYAGRISYDEFYETFSAVAREFIDLCDSRFDEDTPLWLNMFSANVFLRWRDWHVLRKMHNEHPEKVGTPELEKQYAEIAENDYDGWLRSKIKYCLENLK